MNRRSTLIALVAGLALMVSALPAQAQDPTSLFGVSVVEGKGIIVTSKSVYKHNDPVWQQCKAALDAAALPGVPAPHDGGVFLPCWGPPVTTDTTFTASGIDVPDPVNAKSFCVSTLGPCTSSTVGTITGNVVGGVQMGAYSGSSKGISTGTFSYDGPLGAGSYNFVVEWQQSAGTILPLVGRITSGPNAGATIAGFVSARSAPNCGTSGLPSATSTPAGTTCYAVDGMTVSFGAP